MTVRGTLDAEARRAALSKALSRDGVLQLQDAANSWNVHPMTIRRDFDRLVKSGLARRVRGGVVALTGEDYEKRRYQNAEAKRTIADKLQSLVKPEQILALDASTTTSTFAESLHKTQHLTVVTNGLGAFNALRPHQGIMSYLTGGNRDEHNQSLVGFLAVLAIQHFAIDSAIFSATNVDYNFGTSEMTLEQVAFKEAMVDNAAQIILAMDSSKFERRSRFRSIALSRCDVLVTELNPADERLDLYRTEVPTIL